MLHYFWRIIHPSINPDFLFLGGILLSEEMAKIFTLRHPRSVFVWLDLVTYQLHPKMGQVFGQVCLYPTFWLSLPKLSGDFQGETGQSNTSPSESTRAHPPHQLPPFRLRLLARAGLRGPGDIGQVPASSRFRFHPRGSHHHGLQSHGTIGWIQPDRTPPECQGPGCGGDISADVQDFYRPCPLTVRWCLEKIWEKENCTQLYASGSRRCLKLHLLQWGTSFSREFHDQSHPPSHPRRGLKSTWILVLFVCINFVFQRETTVKCVATLMGTTLFRSRVSHAEATDERLTNGIFLALNSNRGGSPPQKDKSVFMFTDYPEFHNSGSPDAHRGFVQRV